MRVAKSGLRAHDRGHRGFSIPELLIALTVISLLGTVGANFFARLWEAHRLETVKLELQRDARAAVGLMLQRLRQATAASVQITAWDNSQPPYSLVRFTTIQGNTIRYYQQGTTLYQEVNGTATVLARNLRYVGFVLPRSEDRSLLAITVVLAQRTLGGRQKTLQMVGEHVRVMN